MLDDKLFLNMYFNAKAPACIFFVVVFFDLLDPTVNYFFITVFPV